MVCRVEEDCDGKKNVLVDGDGLNCWRKRTSDTTFHECVLREVHVLIDTTPFSGSRMIVDKTIDDVIFTCWSLGD